MSAQLAPQRMNYPVTVGLCSGCGRIELVVPLRRSTDPHANRCSDCLMHAPARGDDPIPAAIADLPGATCGLRSR